MRDALGPEPKMGGIQVVSQLRNMFRPSEFSRDDYLVRAGELLAPLVDAVGIWIGVVSVGVVPDFLGVGRDSRLTEVCLFAGRYHGGIPLYAQKFA